MCGKKEKGEKTGAAPLLPFSSLSLSLSPLPTSPRHGGGEPPFRAASPSTPHSYYTAALLSWMEEPLLSVGSRATLLRADTRRRLEERGNAVAAAVRGRGQRMGISAAKKPDKMRQSLLCHSLVVMRASSLPSSSLSSPFSRRRGVVPRHCDSSSSSSTSPSPHIGVDSRRQTAPSLPPSSSPSPHFAGRRRPSTKGARKCRMAWLLTKRSSEVSG